MHIKLHQTCFDQYAYIHMNKRESFHYTIKKYYREHKNQIQLLDLKKKSILIIRVWWPEFYLVYLKNLQCEIYNETIIMRFFEKFVVVAYIHI